MSKAARTNGDKLKYRLFNIDQYNNIIVNFKDQLTSFGPSEKKLLRRGRRKMFYQELQTCVERKDVKKEENLSCLKESLHQECLSTFNDFKTCIQRSRNKNDCNSKLGEYFICVDGSIKEIMLSSNLDY